MWTSRPARARGIPVCNVPDYCINEVADHTLAFILATTRQVVTNCLAVRGGRRGLPVPQAAMKALADLKVGVLGFGRIGREVARRLQAFGCRPRVFDPYVRQASINNTGSTACRPGGPAAPERLDHLALPVNSGNTAAHSTARASHK